VNDFDIPIFKRAYDLYKTFHDYRKLIPKQDRFTVSERCEQSILDLIENIMRASSQKQPDKMTTLEKASLNLNMLRVFVRLMKDAKSLDGKKYITLENIIDEIGRMLGGWIRSTKAA